MKRTLVVLFFFSMATNMCVTKTCASDAMEFISHRPGLELGRLAPPVSNDGSVSDDVDVALLSESIKSYVDYSADDIHKKGTFVVCCYNILQYVKNCLEGIMRVLSHII